MTALLMSCKRGLPYISNKLIAYGANLNATDRKYGHVPLHFAANNGNLEVLKALVEGKANLDMRDKRNKLAIQIAAVCGNHACYELLKLTRREQHTRKLTAEFAFRLLTDPEHEEKLPDLIENLGLSGLGITGEDLTALVGSEKLREFEEVLKKKEEEAEDTSQAEGPNLYPDDHEVLEQLKQEVPAFFQ